MFSCFDSVQGRQARMARAIKAGEFESIKTYVNERRAGVIEYLPQGLGISVAAENHRCTAFILNTCASQIGYGGLTPEYVTELVYTTQNEISMDLLLQCPLVKPDTNMLVHAVQNHCLTVLQKLIIMPDMNLNDAFKRILHILQTDSSYSIEQVELIIALFLQQPDVDPNHLLSVDFSNDKLYVSIKQLLTCQRFDIKTHGNELLYLTIISKSRMLDVLLENENIIPSYRCLELCATLYPEYIKKFLQCPRVDPCSEDFKLLQSDLKLETLNQILLDYRICRNITPPVIRKCIRHAIRINRFDKVNLYLQLCTQWVNVRNVTEIIDESIVEMFVTMQKYDLLLHIPIENIPVNLRHRSMIDAGLSSKWQLFTKLFESGCRPTENQLVVIATLAIGDSCQDVLVQILPEMTTLQTIQKILTFAVDTNNDLLVQLIMNKIDILEGFDIKRILDWACRKGYVDFVRILMVDRRLSIDNLQECFMWACISGRVECVEALLETNINPAYHRNAALVHSIRRGLAHVVTRLMQDDRVIAEIGHDMAMALHGTTSVVRRIMRSDPRIASMPVPSAPPLEGIHNSATKAYRLWNEISYTDEKIMLPVGEPLEEAITQEDIIAGEYIVINHNNQHLYSLDSIRKILNSNPFNPVDPYTRNKIEKITRIRCDPTPTAPPAPVLVREELRPLPDFPDVPTTALHFPTALPGVPEFS